MTVYYFWDRATGPERYIAATIWDPRLSRTHLRAVTLADHRRGESSPADLGRGSGEGT